MSQRSGDMTADFLGRGWAFPPSFAPGGSEVAMVAGEQDIAESLRIIFSTALGQRVMRPDFGCDLNGFMFEAIDRTALTRISSAVSDAILYHEPRIKLDKVNAQLDPQTQGMVVITVTYTVRATNTRFNMVYPFYLLEATAVRK